MHKRVLKARSYAASKTRLYCTQLRIALIYDERDLADAGILALLLTKYLYSTNEIAQQILKFRSSIPSLALLVPILQRPLDARILAEASHRAAAFREL